MSPEMSSRQTREVLTAIGRYLAEVRSLPRLSHEEESRLVARAAAGDRAASASLVERHLRLVVGIARHYAGHGLGLEDLIQEGNLGLLRAASLFDPARGVRFATYAAWWVRQHISRAVFAQAHMIRVPRTVRLDMQRMKELSAALQHQHGRRPTEPEVATAMGRSLARVRFLRSVPEDPFSLDRLVDGRGAIPAASPQSPLLAEASGPALEQGIEDLPPRLAHIIRLRFGLRGGPHLTLREVGAVLHISRERVRQLELQALRRMRAHAVA